MGEHGMSINVQNSTNRVIITPPKAPYRIIISSKGTQGATGAFFRVVDTEADLIPSFGNDRDTAITILDGHEYFKANGTWSATGRTFWGTLLQDTSAYAIAAAASAASAAASSDATSADRLATGQDRVATAASAAASEVSNQASGISAFNAALSESNAAGSAAYANSSALQTASDLAGTGANLTAALIAKAAAEAAAVQTGQDKAATAADRTAVADDKIATGIDRTATAADRVQTGLDKSAAAGSALTASTKAGEAAADRVQTGLDRLAAGASATAAGTKAGEAAASAVLTAADRAATASDRNAAQAAMAGSEAARDVALSTYANLAGGAPGQIPVKASGADFDFSWGNPAVGDMLSSTWAAIINANTAARHAHGNKTVLDATTASYLTAEKTKLAGIAAGATANTGTVTSVGVAVPTGLSATGAITTSGTITISYAAGYQGYTTAEANKLAGIPADADKTPTLAVVATTGSYADLSNKPSLGTAAAQNVSAFATATQGGKADTAVQPAGLTKAAVGLGSVDNTSDAAKPVSAAQQTALNTKIQGDNAVVIGFSNNNLWEPYLRKNANEFSFLATRDQLNEKAGVYKGGWADETNFPVGHTIFCWNAGVPRNGAASPRLHPTEIETYQVTGSGALLSGVWRSRGRVHPNEPLFLMERTE
ncbi:MAG TPA: hypothetical protein VG519_13105 [Pseudochrobactrum sp.]|nr:hypothetical protein [Pseudochrobactrum sp.]